MVETSSHNEEYFCVTLDSEGNFVPGKKRKVVRINLRKSVLQCNACNSHFTERKTYERHLETHATQGTEEGCTCNICGKVLSSKYALKTHQFTHQEKSVQCKYCPYKCIREDYLKYHMKTKHKHIYAEEMKVREDALKQRKKEQCQCETCGKVFLHRSRMTRHRATHLKNRATHLKNQATHLKDSLKCDQCPAMLTTQRTLKHHIIRYHSTEWPFTCSECGKGFILKSEKEYHEKLHSADPQQCKECGKIFLDPKLLDAHVKEHEMTIECTTCGKSFGSQRNLKRHMVLHASRNKFECSVCKRKFSSRRYVNAHMNVHTGETPYICHICGKSYTFSSRCREHITRAHPEHSAHPRERRHKCTFCDHSTFNKTLLQKHITVMHTEKAFACTECDKCFHFERMLTEHMRLHTGQAFKCDVCFKEFTDGTYFKKHVAEHYSEKAHQCPECGKAFHRKSHLTSHMLIHTDEKPFECEVCSKKFCQSSNLKTHMKSHMKDKPDIT